jgi:hypothetical protein
MSNVFYIPGLPVPLLSVFRLVQAGNHVLFTNNDLLVLTPGSHGADADDAALAVRSPRLSPAETLESHHRT